MLESHSIINEKMFEDSLPPINYRISEDYGTIMTARSVASSTDDISGSSVNIYAKINSKAGPNSMVVGSDLYQIVKYFDGYDFKSVVDYSTGLKLHYPVYSIFRKCNLC